MRRGPPAASDHLRGAARPGQAARQRAARRARRRAGRSDRDARLERPPPRRALLRGRRHRRDLPHRQPAPVPRPDRLHRRACRGPLPVHRRDVPAAARAAGAPADEPAGHLRARRGGGPAGDRARGPRLREPDRRPSGGTRMAELRRDHRLRPVLHLGHHRQPQGRALPPPLHGAARARDRAARRHGPEQPRDRAAGGADVPRQRLGPALRLPAGRRAHGDAGAAAGRRQPVRGVRARAGDLRLGGADDLVRPAQPPEGDRPATDLAAAGGDRRRGGAALDDRDLRAGTMGSRCCTAGA